MNDQHLHRVEVRVDTGYLLRGLRAECADELPAYPRGIGHRTEEVKERFHAELGSGPGRVFHGGMEERRVQKTDSYFVDACAGPFGGELDIHSEGFEDVGASASARHRSVPVLRDRDA